MKLIETLTSNDIRTILTGGVNLLFNTIFQQEDEYYSLAPKICYEYYLSHSAEKTVAPLYENTYKYHDPNSSDEIYPDVLIGGAIRSKFKEKWDKIYNALIVEEYNALNDHKYTVTKNGTTKDTITYDNTITDDGNENVNITRSDNSNASDKVYGFNSNTPVPTDEGTSENTQQTIGNKDDNTTHNIRVKNGTDQRDNTYNHSEKYEGYRENPQDAITRELTMRSRFLFFNIVFKDIDSLLCLEIYEY